MVPNPFARRVLLGGMAATAALGLVACGTTSAAPAGPGPTPTSSMTGMLGNNTAMPMSGVETASPGSTDTGTPVAGSTLSAIANAIGAAGSVDYTFAVTGSDMMSIWPSGHGSARTAPAPALSVAVDRMSFMGQSNGSMSLVSVAGKLFVRSARYADGKTWMLVPPDDSTDQSFQGLHTQTDALDPRLQLSLILASRNMHATSLGTSVPGTTHYTGQVTVKQLSSASALDPASRAALARVYPSLQLRPLSVDVWVDSAQRPVRLEVLHPTPAGSLELAMTFTGYGSTAAITEPSPVYPTGPSSG